MNMRRRPRLTETQFDQWAESLRGWIGESVSPFADDSPEAQAERIARAERDILFFAETYLPHYFNSPCAEMHEDWAELADDETEPLFLAAPREHAKSTFWSLAVPLHRALFGMKHFILLISDTNDQATGFTLPIKLEIEENPRISYDFQIAKGHVWKKNHFEFNETRIMARGRGEKVRGLKFRQHRPDAAIVDDAENDKNVQNPRLVKELMAWLRMAVMGSMAEQSLFVMVGNLFHPRSALSRFIAETDDEGQPLYRSRIYRAVLDIGTPNERPLWPQRWSMERLNRKRHFLTAAVFNAEMMNLVVEEDSPFREEWFRFFELEEMPQGLQVASFTDPSAKKTESGDFKAVVTVGMDVREMKFYVLGCWIRRATVGEMFGAAEAAHTNFGGIAGIEENMFQDFLHHAIQNRAREVGRYLPWFPVHHATNKIARIVGTLAYLVEHGKILFCKNVGDTMTLIEQLVYIHNATVNDDGPDALEGAVSLLQSGAAGGVIVA